MRTSKLTSLPLALGLALGLARGLALGLALALAGCNGGDSGTSAQPGVVSGAILFVPETVAPLVEVEPNDSADLPQAAGVLRAGERRVVRGELAPGDPFDAFAFEAPERCRVEAEVTFAGAPARRVQLAAFDPVAMDFVAAPDEGGRASFVARGAFDVVVRGSAGLGAYELVVHALPVGRALAQPGWIGAFGVGDGVALAAPEAARFELTALEAQTLSVRVEPGPGARLLDAAVEPPALLGEVAGGATATFAVRPLARLALECAAGARATLTGAEPAQLAVQAPRLAPAGRERARWGLAASEAAYGRAAHPLRAGDVLVKARGAAALAGDLARRGFVERDRVGEDVIEAHADVDAIADESERARATVALVRSLAASARVEYAEPNRVRTAQGGPFTPDDEFFGLQWHYRLIRLPEAWADVQTFAQSQPLDDAVVAVIDTGRRPHPDLDANTRTDIEYDFISDPASARDGNGPDADAFDEGDSTGLGPSSFHGTHVAGTIAAVTDNAVGVAGVGAVPAGMPLADHVQVVHLRALGLGGGADADIARAVRYAAALQNPGYPLLPQPLAVINLSLGGPGSSSTLANAVTAARNRGVTIFAAAGNENSGTPFYPAAYPGVVSVAAVDLNGNRAPYSNFHSSVDLCAPGGDASVDRDGDGYVDGVLSTLVDEATGDPIYVFYEGTSMACPHAAGLAALMKSVDRNLSPAQIESKLASTATDLGAPGRDSLYGDGLINALLAVQSAGTGVPGTPVLGVNPTALDFGASATQLALSVLNLGTGSITLGTGTSNQPWLTLAPIAAPPGGDVNVASIVCTVDRAHPALAADGTYTATINLTSTVGNVMVPVSVVVDSTPPLDVDLFVLALEYDGVDLVTVAQAVVNPSTDLAYALDELTTIDGLPLSFGDYLIVCGSDDDMDGFICGDADVYCGIYPTLNDPALVRVNGDVDGVDFVVAPLTSVSGAAATGAVPRGYRRLR